MVTLDETEQKYVSDTLTHCIAVLGMRMTDPNVCEVNRDRAMEYHRMAIKARSIVDGKESEATNA